MGSSNPLLHRSGWGIEALEDDEDLDERLDAFESRIGHMQDTLGDKLLPSLLRPLAEKPGSAPTSAHVVVDLLVDTYNAINLFARSRISSTKTELRLKFIRSRLGWLWMILNPLAQVLIFAIVLSAVLSAKLPGIDNQYAYAIYLMAGMLSWSLFTEIVNGA